MPLTIYLRSKFGTMLAPACSLTATCIECIHDSSEMMMDLHMVETEECWQLLGYLLHEPNPFPLPAVPSVQSMVTCFEVSRILGDLNLLNRLLEVELAMGGMLHIPIKVEKRQDEPFWDPVQDGELAWREARSRYNTSHPQTMEIIDPHEGWNIFHFEHKGTETVPDGFYPLVSFSSSLHVYPSSGSTIVPTRSAMNKSIMWEAPRVWAAKDLLYDIDHPEKGGYVIAGGAALKCLTGDQAWTTDDIDFYRVTTEPSEEEEDALRTLASGGSASSSGGDKGPDVYNVAGIFKTGSGSSKLHRTVYRSVQQIFNHFDIDPCKVALVKSSRTGMLHALVDPSAAISIQSRCYLIRPEQAASGYAQRLLKYMGRGYIPCDTLPWLLRNTTEGCTYFQALLAVLYVTMREHCWSRDSWMANCHKKPKVILQHASRLLKEGAEDWDVVSFFKCMEI